MLQVAKVQESPSLLSTIKKCKHSSNHANAHQHTLACMCSPLPRWTGSASHMDSTQCWRADSIMAPGEARMMDMVCRWEWTLRAWGHRRSTALPPLPSVSTGWAQTRNPAWGCTLQDHLQHTPHFWGKEGRSARHRIAAHLHILQFNDCYCHTCSHRIVHCIFFCFFGLDRWCHQAFS